MVTGARRGELCALRWRHLDHDRQVVVIRASIAQNGADIREKRTKLHQRRHLTLDPDTVAVLIAYPPGPTTPRRPHRSHAHRRVVHVLPRADGASWRPPASLTRQYRRLVTRLGIHTTLHKLRHYSATELIAAGVDLRTVAGRLGQSDGGTTLAHYTVWVREADQRASLALRNRLPTPRLPPATSPVVDARPPSPYQALATELRTGLPTVQLGAKRWATAHSLGHHPDLHPGRGD